MSATGPELHPGDIVPGTKYRVVKAVGAGGMGVVYQVVKSPNIQGVLKLMSTELTSEHDLLVRFFDEVRILARLDHPNIVKVFDYDCLEDGTPFYVMELLSGRTVRDVLGSIGRVPPRVAYEITRQLLEALQCAHTHEVPVIHRDIKPENIFLHAPRHGEPVVKLIDFGVSAVADRLHDHQFVGTWSYAAPEQIRGEKPTPATDIYSAGLVLYEMLAGVGPFDHHVDWPLISEAQLKEIPAPVAKFAPWVPASIVALIASALAKDPRSRPRDAYAFAERLFELEWASDGKNPHDFTSEGPLATSSGNPRAASRAPAGPGLIASDGNGPLSRILSTVTGVSKKMAAAAPAADRLGDVPLIGVPPESVMKGPTSPGVGDGRTGATNTNDLLAGLGVAPRKPPSKRERESAPDFDGGLAVPKTPRVGQVVIRAGVDASPSDEYSALTKPRAIMPRYVPDAPTLSGPASSVNAFAAAPSDSSSAPAMRRGPLIVLGAALLFGLAVGGLVVLRPRPPVGNVTTSMTAALTVPDPPPVTAVPPDPEPPASSAAEVRDEVLAPATASPRASVDPVAAKPLPSRTPSVAKPSGARPSPSASARARGDYMRLP